MIRIDKYAIKADQCCYIAGEYKVTKDKNTGEDVETIANPKYYRTVHDAVEALLVREQRRLVQENDLTLQEAITAFRELQDAFTKHLTVIKEGIDG